jgi:outer membrane protein assembly factor BamA
MPIFKQYFLGGPNSMRAWGLRQLGLGSSIISDTYSSSYTDRFGNFALEGNIEYRFTIWDLSSVKIASALYVDMGNIWTLNNNPADPNSVFTPARLGKDLAIGIGSGLRLDANYFLIRLDFAYKVKDPARQTNDGWLDLSNIKLRERRSNGVEINNLVFQFGIGLPF